MVSDLRRSLPQDPVNLCPHGCSSSSVSPFGLARSAKPLRPSPPRDQVTLLRFETHAELLDALFDPLQAGASHLKNERRQPPGVERVSASGAGGRAASLEGCSRAQSRRRCSPRADRRNETARARSRSASAARRSSGAEAPTSRSRGARGSRAGTIRSARRRSGAAPPDQSPERFRRPGSRPSP